ncbi:hypothetical protein Tco_0881056, partial [Tanacetum coccineum]
MLLMHEAREAYFEPTLDPSPYPFMDVAHPYGAHFAGFPATYHHQNSPTGGVSHHQNSPLRAATPSARILPLPTTGQPSNPPYGSLLAVAYCPQQPLISPYNVVQAPPQTAFGYQPGYVPNGKCFGGHITTQPNPHGAQQSTDLALVFSSMSIHPPPQDPNHYMNSGASAHISYSP